MKTTTTLAILSIIVFACHRRTVAASDEIVISNKTEFAKTKTTPTGEAMSAGQTIYSSRCGRCHYLKTVQDYTPQQWDNILKSMVPKARLNKDEATQLTVYVMEHAKK
ncbi:MAG TPA: hypothetical protein VI385_09725 [Flavisolibacter sp.]|jgi:hypothetical protein